MSLPGCIPETGTQKTTPWKPPVNAESVTVNVESVNDSALEYINSTAFDQSLSNAMTQADTKIDVAVITPFSSNNIPERLDSWLTVITENGGEVSTKPASGERDIVAVALTLYSVYQIIKAQIRYVPAQNYHATLLYRRNDSGDALIEKIVFTRK